MRAIVLGSGVIGVTSAYYLAKQGFKVTVIDRQPGPALETSFANAGQISPGYSTPWAAPGIPLKALKWMFSKHAPLAIRPDGSFFQLQWLAMMLRNCTAERYNVNKERMLRLAEYSRNCLIQLRSETGIEYEGRQAGTLQVFRTQQQMDGIAKDVAILMQAGVPFELLGSHELANREPALAAVSHKLVGGLRLPGDETGDCQLFTVRLAEKAAELGVQFRYDQNILGIQQVGGRIASIKISDGLKSEELKAQHFVMALGSYSRQTAAKLGLKIPVYPLKGYSLTVPIIDADRAPVSTVMDETYKIAMTRFDDRIRVGGMAEVAGFDTSLNPRRRETLEMVVNDLFPEAGNLQNANFWTGLRPMTPDGTPIVGATPIRNLWMNTGHGTLGWTMACGSASLLADLISARQPAINPAGLAMDRYAPASSAAAIPSAPAVAAATSASKAAARQGKPRPGKPRALTTS